MPERSESPLGTRVVALVGPGGAGKTSLAESMLRAAGATDRQGSVDSGSSVGDSSPEARSRRGSTELNLMRFDYLGDSYVLLDCPGSAGFAADGTLGLAVADMAIVVVDPDGDRALLAEPVLRQLEDMGIPHAIFVNKVDQARGSIRSLLQALQPLSRIPLIARQIPIREGERINGFVDLALERAFHYRPGQPSERIEIPADLAAREAEDRFHMLEQLADHDDALLEQLLMDESPDLSTVLADLARETRKGQSVPVFFGSAQNGFGVRRLQKALRHEAPLPALAAERLGAVDGCAFVFKISHASAVGRLALARVFGKELQEGAELRSAGGADVRIGALFTVQGEKTGKVQKASAGEIVAIAKADDVVAGEWLGAGRLPDEVLIDRPQSNHVLAVSTRDRKDDVRLSTALHKLVEEDGALSWHQDEEMHETRLTGINDEHLNVTLARLKRRYGVAVDARTPGVGYKESIRRSVTQRGRHKKQSGGHGQFGDVVIEVRPLPRGEGFQFNEKITGGAIPKQWIPAVEQGVRDAMTRGPLGFPVVDVAVTLTDGSFHSVDSSELAFRTAGRIAMAEALAACAPHLLEPVQHLTVHSPSSATSRISSALASRRGQMLGLGPREGWPRWDTVEALLPESELQGLDSELRSLSQGLATYSARFDHLAELNGKLADDIVHRELEPA
jgi:elongation factor G